MCLCISIRLVVFHLLLIVSISDQFFIKQVPGRVKGNDKHTINLYSLRTVPGLAHSSICPRR